MYNIEIHRDMDRRWGQKQWGVKTLQKKNINTVCPSVIPRGIAACKRDFTFYQKKQLEPNPGKPRQITSHQKNYYRILIFLAGF